MDVKKFVGRETEEPLEFFALPEIDNAMRGRLRKTEKAPLILTDC